MTAMIYPTTNPAAAEQMMVTRGEGPYISVSYTHLTLPTSDLV